jgi:hypothetical protein
MVLSQNAPAALRTGEALKIGRESIVEWIVEDKNRLLLRRRKVPTATLKKTKRGKA